MAIEELDQRRSEQAKLMHFRENDKRPRHVDNVTKEIVQEEIRKHGLHVVANWEGGGSDALDIPIHSLKELLDEYPETDKKEAKRFFNGEIDEIVIRTWTDDDHDDEKVVDTAYWPIDFSGSGEVYYYEDNDLIDEELL